MAVVGDDKALGHVGGPVGPDPPLSPLVRPEARVYKLVPGLTGLGITECILREFKEFA